MTVSVRDRVARVERTGVSRVAAAEFALREAFRRAPEDSASQHIAPFDRPVDIAGTSRITARLAEPEVLVPSHRGVDSARLLISMDGLSPSLLLKSVHPDQRIFLDAAASFDAQRKAAALGSAPEIVAFDETRAVSVSEYLEGWATARVSDLKKPERLHAVIRAKRKIHSGPRFKSTWSVFDRIRMLRTRCDPAMLDAAGGLRTLLDSVFHIERMIAAAGVDTVPAHADGLASNILIGPTGRIQLVDFDEARNVDPYYELALLANEAFEEEGDYRLALEMAEGRPRQASLHRIRLYCIADDLAWAMWGLFMDATSPRKGVEFYRYACWRLLRCRNALAAIDLAHYARSI